MHCNEAIGNELLATRARFNQGQGLLTVSSIRQKSFECGMQVPAGLRMGPYGWEKSYGLGFFQDLGTLYEYRTNLYLILTCGCAAGAL